jgi:hypothetical protein
MVCSARFSVFTGWKGAGAHVQRNAGALHAARLQRGQHTLVEMQRGCGCGHGAGVAGKHGLVAALVVSGVGVGDVGRQRHVAVALHQGMGLVAEAQVKQRAVGFGPAPEQRGGVAARHGQRGAHRRLLADLHMGHHLVPGQDPLHQQFQLAARGLFAEQPRLDDLGVVEHQQVARVQKVREVAKGAVHRRRSAAVKQA